MSEKKSFSLLPYLLVFLGTFLLLQVVMPKQSSAPNAEAMGDLYLETVKDEYAIGKDIKVSVYNNTSETVQIAAPRSVLECEPSFIIYKYSSTGFNEASDPEATCNYKNAWLEIEPGKKKVVSLVEQSYTSFGETGRYKVALESNGTIYESPEFEINEPGFFTRIWRGVIYQPMLNALVALVSYMPGHQLGLAVIALTIIIRTLLLVPSQRAIEAQMRMQEVQPKLEELKEKYKDDQARLAQETMALWKAHKVSPFSSCLPILIQLPIFLALFYVIQAGLSPDKSIFIYPFLQGFDLSLVNSMFLGLNLLEQSLIILPVIVGGLQFLQMQMMISKKKAPTAKMAEVEMANKIMRFLLPLLIAFFTAQLPAAVGIYWGTNTIYGILQQLVVKKFRPLKSNSKGDEDVSVRVINKNHGKGH